MSRHTGIARGSARPQVFLHLALAACFTGAVGTAAYLGWLPRENFFWIAALSLLAIILYGKDKWAAVGKRWRTSEGRLHLVGVLGGWPGALLAQHLFNHKTSKRSFRIIFWLTVLINCGLIGWTLTEVGRNSLQESLSAAERLLMSLASLLQPL